MFLMIHYWKGLFLTLKLLEMEISRDSRMITHCLPLHHLRHLLLLLSFPQRLVQSVALALVVINIRLDHSRLLEDAQGRRKSLHTCDRFRRKYGCICLDSRSWRRLAIIGSAPQRHHWILIYLVLFYIQSGHPWAWLPMEPSLCF